MRILVEMRARADTAYDNAYHHKLRGRIWDALEGTEFEELHDDGQPTPFSYGNPFPPYDMTESDERKLLIAATDEELLAHIAADLQEQPEFNIGEMPFTVTDISPVWPDVGEPGTSGTIDTATGVVIRIPPWRFDEYGIESDSEQSEFWRPRHEMEPFRNQIVNNLDKKHSLFCPDHLRGPSEWDGSLFDGFDFQKTYALPVTTTAGQTETYVVSKWEFEYTVQDEDHRRFLNLLLDVGIGGRNALGFGFVNIIDKHPAGQLQSGQGVF